MDHSEIIALDYGKIDFILVLLKQTYIPESSNQNESLKRCNCYTTQA